MPSASPIFNTDIWQELGDGSPVKKVISGVDASQKVAFFKPLSRRGSAPVGANEYIASEIASLLDFPAAQIQLIKFGDTDGYLSHEVSNAFPWQAFPDKANSRKYFQDQTVFAKIIAFDYWVMNQDRHGGNLIFNPASQGTYQLYMIDHEHCLYGGNEAPPSNPDDFSGILREKDLAKQLANLEELIAEAKKIETVGDDTIRQIVDTFQAQAPTYLSQGQAQVIKDLLLRRKSLLIGKLTECYNKGDWKS